MNLPRMIERKLALAPITVMSLFTVPYDGFCECSTYIVTPMVNDCTEQCYYDNQVYISL